MEMQARYFALLASGAKSLPDKDTMAEMAAGDASRFLSQFGHNARRIRNLVDYHRFMDGMAALIGCEPPLVSSFFLRPRLWLRMVYGPTQATQFRLRGPGKKPRLGAKLPSGFPMSPVGPPWPKSVLTACHLRMAAKPKRACSWAAITPLVGVSCSGLSAAKYVYLQCFGARGMRCSKNGSKAMCFRAPPHKIISSRNPPES
jgi:hypothetical protein